MEEIDLKELFTIFWGKKTQIIIITLIFVILGMLYTTFLVKPKYKSSTTLILTQQTNKQGDVTYGETITANDINLNSKLVPTYAEFLKSNTVIRQVLKNLQMNEEEEDIIRKSIAVSAKDNTEIIEITITSDEPKNAAILANEMAKVFTEKVKEKYNINNVSILDEAEEDDVPYNINHVKDIIIFMIIGLVVAIGYVLISYMLDTSVKDAEDVEKVVNVPVLASIPIYDEEEATKGGARK